MQKPAFTFVMCFGAAQPPARPQPMLADCSPALSPPSPSPLATLCFETVPSCFRGPSVAFGRIFTAAHRPHLRSRCIQRGPLPASDSRNCPLVVFDATRTLHSRYSLATSLLQLVDKWTLLLNALLLTAGRLRSILGPSKTQVKVKWSLDLVAPSSGPCARHNRQRVRSTTICHWQVRHGCPLLSVHRPAGMGVSHCLPL